MDRRIAMMEVGRVINNCPEEYRETVERVGKVMLEYMDFEMGTLTNNLAQRIKSLENKIEFFYKPTQCPKCGSNHLLKVISPRTERGKTYCKGCGLVI